jgi:hypothetical protein
MADFDGEVLVPWSRNPVTEGTLRYVDDANVLIMLDNPEQTAREIGAFLAR